MKHPLVCQGLHEYGCQSRRGTLATNVSEDGSLYCDACCAELPRSVREYMSELDADEVREILRAALRYRWMPGERKTVRSRVADLIGWLRDDAYRAKMRRSA